jgi:hypothetical protein
MTGSLRKIRESLLDEIALLGSFYRIKQPLGISWTSEKISSLLQGFVIIKREHHNGLIPISRDNHWITVIADTVHRRSKILSRGSVGNRSHMDSIVDISGGVK